MRKQLGGRLSRLSGCQERACASQAGSTATCGALPAGVGVAPSLRAPPPLPPPRLVVARLLLSIHLHRQGLGGHWAQAEGREKVGAMRFMRLAARPHDAHCTNLLTTHHGRRGALGPLRYPSPGGAPSCQMHQLSQTQQHMIEQESGGRSSNLTGPLGRASACPAQDVPLCT